MTRKPMHLTGMDAMRLPGCAIYVHEHRLSWSKKITPPNWEYTAIRAAQELWIARALQSHPWRVNQLQQADIVIIVANLSLLCSTKHHMYAYFKQWRNLVTHAPALLQRALNGSVRAPRVAGHLESACPVAPWARISGASARDHIQPPKRFMRMRDLAASPDDVVAPPVFTGQQWLSSSPSTATHQSMTHARWRGQPLLFFAGHIPKLHGQ